MRYIAGNHSVGTAHTTEVVAITQDFSRAHDRGGQRGDYVRGSRSKPVFRYGTMSFAYPVQETNEWRPTVRRPNTNGRVAKTILTGTSKEALARREHDGNIVIAGLQA
jgi:hypothetical protein